MSGWIGVDLDGTLAHYEDFKGPERIGEPIPRMVNRVKAWLSKGKEVRIFTARVWNGEEGDNPDPEKWRDVEKVKGCIRAWCLEHIGQELPITNVKDYGMIELWDDRVVQVEINTGIPVDPRKWWTPETP